MQSELRIIDPARLIVGECPLWDDQRALLYTIDIRGKCIRQTDLTSGEHRQFDFPQEIGCIALCKDGDLIAGMTDGIYRIRLGETMEPVCVPKSLKGRRFNDGKVGPDGRFYVGTTDYNGQGAFYRLDHDGTLTELFDQVGSSNGLAWSSDHRTLYYCDSPKRVLEAFEFDLGTGSLSSRRTVMSIPCGVGEFDGMTIDAQGMLWIAGWRTFHAYRIDPVRAQVVEQIRFPVARVSCCGFAGEELSTLAITTAAYQADASAEPLAGSTFAIRADVPGVPSWRFGA